MPFQEAVDTLDLRAVIGSPMDSAQWSAVAVGLRNRAYWSSRVESVRVLQRSRDSIRDFLTGARATNDKGETYLKTGSRSTFVKQMQDLALSEGMGPLVPEDAGTVRDFTSQTRQELIWDTQTRQAYDYGDYLQSQDPDVLDAFPAQRFIREIPVKEPRHEHTQYEGVVQLKTNTSFWKRINQDFGVPWGPWGWGCGHSVEDVDRAEAERLGLIKPGERPKPSVHDFNSELKASTENLDPDMQALLKQSLGNQIEIRDGAARWTLPTQALSVPPTPSPAPVSPTAIQVEPEPPQPILQPTNIEPLKIEKKLSARKVGESVTIVTQGTPMALPASVAKRIGSALEVIDSAHDDGKLEALKILRQAAGDPSLGSYHTGGKMISINTAGPRIEMTTAHEIGHWLDEQALGSVLDKSGKIKARSDLATHWHVRLKDWRKAILESPEYAAIENDPKMNRGRQRYLLRLEELWARSYAQWVATVSGNRTMNDQLDTILAGEAMTESISQWSKQSFAPIKTAIDNLFKTLHWI